VAAFEDETLGEARLRLADERFGTELLELRKRVFEQAMSVLELPAAGTATSTAPRPRPGCGTSCRRWRRARTPPAAR